MSHSMNDVKNVTSPEEYGIFKKVHSHLWKTFCYPCNVKFIFIKTFYFAFYGGLGCILPFLSVYFKQSGLTPLQIGWIWGVKPVMTLIGAPLWGAIGDGYHISRFLLVSSLFIWVAIYSGIVFLPSPRKHYSCSIRENNSNLHELIILNYTTENQNHTHVKNTMGSRLLMMNQINETLLKNDYNWTESVVVNKGNERSLVVNTEESLWWLYEPEDTYRVFIMVMVIIIVGEFFTSPATALADAGTTQTLGAKNMEYFGTQRAWGPVGFAFSSALVGYFISKTRYSDVFCGVTVFFSSYSPMIYALIVCMLLSVICASQMKFKTSKTKDPERSHIIDEVIEGDNHIYNTLYVVKRFLNIYYGSWLITAVFAGMCNGIVSGFLYWHMDNLGADQFLIGMASVTVSITEFLAFFLVRNLAKIIGHKGVIYLSLSLYTVRFIIYGAVTQPAYILIAEVFRVFPLSYHGLDDNTSKRILDTLKFADIYNYLKLGIIGLAYSSMWVSLVTYTSDILPESCYATLQGIMLGLHLGLGSGTGQLIGGILVHYYGACVTFYIFAALSLLYLLLFFLAQKFSQIPTTQYEMFENNSQTD